MWDFTSLPLTYRPNRFHGQAYHVGYARTTRSKSALIPITRLRANNSIYPYGIFYVLCIVLYGLSQLSFDNIYAMIPHDVRVTYNPFLDSFYLGDVIPYQCYDTHRE